MELPTTESPVRLIQGDALESMRRLPDGSFDCIVTDPPFGVRSETWDDMDGPEFARFSMAWLAEARRLAGELVVFGTGYGPLRQLCELLWPRVRVMVWDKPIGSQYGGAAERGMWHAHEIIFHCHAGFDPAKGERIATMIRVAREAKGLSRSAVDMKARGRKTGLCYRWEEASCVPTPEQAERLSDLLGLNGDFLSLVRECSRPAEATGRDVFSHRTITNGDHPCEKPVRLMADLIECTTEPGDLIIDPFAGSGTTLIACLMTGRRCIGIEADAGHFATARRRVDGFQGVGGLFEKPAPLSLFTG